MYIKLYFMCSYVLDDPPQQSVTFQLQKLFFSMLTSNLNAVSPNDVFSCLQIDVQQESSPSSFLSTLLSSLKEESILIPSLTSLLQQLKGIQLDTKCCLNCHRVFFTSKEFSCIVFIFSFISLSLGRFCERE